MQLHCFHQRTSNSEAYLTISFALIERDAGEGLTVAIEHDAWQLCHAVVSGDEKEKQASSYCETTLASLVNEATF
jgi:hypothetical protein